MRRLASCGVSLLLALAPGCLRGGEGWSQTPRERPPAAKAEPGELELIVLGSARASSATAALARELERVLAAAHAAERPAVVAWLGTDFGRPGLDRSQPCPAPDAAYAAAPLAELARVLAEAEEHGASSWGLPGPDGLRCALHEQPAPYSQPALNYVVRVYGSGELELASRCEGPRCELLPEREQADADPVRVELVFGELAAWHYPDILAPEADEQLDLQQRSLLEALAAAPPRPRIFLSSIPLDSAGPHGLGGRLQRTGIRYFPAALRQAIEAGQFVGVVGGLERNLQIRANLSASILRNRRAIVERPVFGVVSGAAGGAAPTPPTSRGDAMIPELEAARAGFVRIVIRGDRVRLEAHARAGRSWRVASLEVPLEPAPFEGLHPSPVIQPCPACDPKGGAGDGEPL